ncbi:MAG: hypothetical protein WDM88_12175 [Galbitalea sp.]
MRIAFGPPLPLTGERHLVSVRLRTAMQGLVASLQEGYPDGGAGQWWHPALSAARPHPGRGRRT